MGEGMPKGKDPPGYLLSRHLLHNHVLIHHHRVRLQSHEKQGKVGKPTLTGLDCVRSDPEEPHETIEERAEECEKIEVAMIGVEWVKNSMVLL